MDMKSPHAYANRLRFGFRSRTWKQASAFLGAALLLSSSPVGAQSDSALGNAVVALWNGNSISAGSLQSMHGRLFGAIVTATVTNGDANPKNLGDLDRVLSFQVRNPLTGKVVTFPAAAAPGSTKSDFVAWVNANSKELINAFFPASLSEAVAGRDAISSNAQAFVESIVLGIPTASESGAGGPRRASASGGLVEVEGFSGEARAGSGFQALVKLPRQISLLARYAQETENDSPLDDIQQRVPVTATSTKSINVAAVYHPSRLVNDEYDWRVGVDAHTGFFFAQAATLDLGSLDYGGGVWTSAQKNFLKRGGFNRLHLAVGSLFGGTQSHVPLALLPSNSDDTSALAKAFNDRGVQWDVTYGIVGGYALSGRTSLNVKTIQTLPAASDSGRPTLTTVMGSVSYLVGGLTPIDIGYKHTVSGDVTSHSVFLQGNFGF